ncbi:hypothetical protein ACFFOM_17350 [Microlunatus capsulatus]|uniref:Uncharacterized protein n=1 Tax=Microlunatus capsulatus TaxID=99117 RepID=A0ABS4ZC58_9ACTN|nr:hypothetical protein [Microlunatus capsulatus]MBP2418594.1 hypothetical protein [Microlunatus capsulatus]
MTPTPVGSWRTGPVWIGRSATSPVGADHMAPRAALVPGLWRT